VSTDLNADGGRHIHRHWQCPLAESVPQRFIDLHDVYSWNVPAIAGQTLRLDGCRVCNFSCIDDSAFDEV
jgi:hypothetical protein